MFPVITLHDIRVVARLCDYNQVLYTWQISRSTEKVLKMCLTFEKSVSGRILATVAGISDCVLLQPELDTSILHAFRTF